MQLGHAKGSASELLSGFILSHKLGFLSQDELSKMRILIEEESKMINSLITAIKNKNK